MDVKLPIVSAPGKIMIAGEYAVLEGAPALVAAVGARARAFWSAPMADGSDGDRSGSAERKPLPPEVVLSRSLAEEVSGRVPYELGIDVSELRRSDRKLGLGSSAAAAAAASAAVFAYAGHDLEAPATRRQVLETALAGHAAVAPQGSGADVAASVLGGFVRFRKADPRPEVRSVAWPDGLEARIVWTAAEARTSDLVAQVAAFATRDPATHRRCMDGVAAAAASFLEAFGSGDLDGVVRATEVHCQAMDRLGREAKAPIVEATLERVAALARRAGGAAKPAGAGGGDVALGFFATATAARDFDARCAAEGLTILDLPLGAEGVIARPS